MKRLLKKLMAGAMAGVMVLGMAITAGATESSNVVGNKISGRGALEHTKANNTITVVLPTIGNNDLNMILDPHNMIALTNAEAWKDSAGRVPTFEAGSNVFFRNKVKNTMPKSTTITVASASTSVKVFKKVETASPAAYIYRAKEPTTSGGTDYKWYAEISGAMTELTTSTSPAKPGANDDYTGSNVTIDPPDAGSGSVYRSLDEEETITVSSTDVVAIKYETLTVTGRWLEEGATEADNKVYIKGGNSVAAANVDSALAGKGIADIIAAGYEPVPTTEYAYDYSSTSDDLKVINKSYSPLTVRVQAELSKIDTTSNKEADVELVDATTKLVDEENGKSVGARMYVALENSAVTDPVVLEDATFEEDETTTPPTKVYQVKDLVVTRDYTAYALTPTSIYNLDLIKGQPKFEWLTEDNDARTALNSKFKDDGTTSFQITYAPSTDTFDITALNNPASGATPVIEMVLQDDAAEDPTVVKGNGQAVPVYVNMKASASDEETARISMVLDGLKAGAVTAPVTDVGDTTAGSPAVTTNKGPAITITKWLPKAEATSAAALPVFESGFKLVSSNSGVTSLATFADITNIKSGATYTYEVNPDVPESRFSSASFHINAGINTVDAWDLAKGEALSLSLIYDVNKHNADTDPALPEDEEPTITVVTPGTDVNNSTVEMKVTLGTGNSSYDRVIAFKWTPEGSAEKTVNILTTGSNTFDASTLTVKIKYTTSTTAASNMEAGTGWKLVFVNDLTDETTEVPFNIHTAGTYPAS